MWILRTIFANSFRKVRTRSCIVVYQGTGRVIDVLVHVHTDTCT